MDSELTPHQKGRNAESLIRQILEDLKTEGLILGFRQTRRHSKDDRNGIDFFIFTEPGRIPLQVKSSFCGYRMHTHYTHKNWVPCVVAKGPNIRRRVVEIIDQYWERQGNGSTAG